MLILVICCYFNSGCNVKLNLKFILNHYWNNYFNSGRYFNSGCNNALNDEWLLSSNTYRLSCWHPENNLLQTDWRKQGSYIVSKLCFIVWISLKLKAEDYSYLFSLSLRKRQISLSYASLHYEEYGHLRTRHIYIRG